MPLERDTEGRTFVQHPNGQRSHYIRDSFADPWKPHDTILIQHGFGRHAAFWYHWIPALARHYHVIRRDLRGHGYSSFPKPGEKYDYSLDTILDEIIDTIDQLGIKKVHFLGESTGGMLGEILAARHPNRLHSLTVCSTPTHLPEPALKLFAFDRKDWPTACRELGSRGWAEALSKVPGTIPIEDKAFLPWYLDQISISSGAGLAGYADFLSSLDARPYLSSIKIPTLILAPSRSAATKLEEQQGLMQQIEGSKIEVIQAPGHEIYVTQPEKCQSAFLAFLAQLARSRNV
ncbi:Alpha/Beta hydrolase protein [Clohesyomyces aquaticus]|uniref:Alpha/Beta hydrolase protein n=1 Tax=Clohesyomyces aquaticus TaxID=1231657 RepID=A0A1Y2A084_9PLEO|nr:Alpha/Beta hydrolase protein [Clohesyomyces aquaticus]